MLRWWSCLAEEAAASGGVVGSSPLGAPPEAAWRGPQGRWRKAIFKYATYPVKVRQHPKADLYHLLDHSWAHLLKHVPRGRPCLATVHDLIPLRYPDGMSPGHLKRWRELVREIDRCECIIADSLYTKSEITALLGIGAEKIEVVPLGVDLRPRPAAPPTRVSQSIADLRRGGADLVIGLLGSALGRKNLGIVPPAVRWLRQQGLRVAVVRAGPPLTPGLAEQFQALEQVGGFVDFGFISDRQVDEFYGAIDVQVMPSLYEGFGLPVLEAMAFGTAVVSSHASSLPEVAGDAAALFDPHSWESLAQALQSMEAPLVRQDWGERGRLRAQSFSWGETWRRYRDIYQRYLPKAPRS